MTRKRQAGAALITAMVITMIATTLAVAMMTRMTLDIKRVTYTRYDRQTYHYALGVESWALGRLFEDARQQNASNQVDSFDDVWSKKFQFTVVNNEANVDGLITDQQGLININNLSNNVKPANTGTPPAPGNTPAPAPGSSTPASGTPGGGTPAPGTGTIPPAQQYYNTLTRLMVQLEVDPAIADAIVDWVDSDSQMKSATGAEDDGYLDKQPAYRTANTGITSVSELKQIKGMTPEAYAKLAPFLTALPRQTRINVNTAPPQVLKTLSPDIDDALLESIVQARKDKPFPNTATFINIIKNHVKPKNIRPANLDQIITVSSQYFVCESRVTMKETRLILRSLIVRNNRALQVVARQTRTE